MTWNRESAGRYVREDGALIERDRNARVNDLKWIAWGPGDDDDAALYEDTLEAAKAAADDFWPVPERLDTDPKEG